jgi:hypothetical protein
MAFGHSEMVSRLESGMVTEIMSELEWEMATEIPSEGKLLD